jgi:hypothetical protein
MSLRNIMSKKLLNTTKFIYAKSLSTSASQVYAKNKYITSTRDIIIQNERLREMIKVKEECAGITKVESDKEICHNNLNPRNIELLGWNKPSGFSTLHEKRNFFNKLSLMVTHRHTKAFVENINGEIICYASTTEHYIAKRLHNTTDVSAVVNIAQILAIRLKQIGLERVHWFTYENRTTEKVREFEGILRNSGIILAELPTRVLQGPHQTLPPPQKERVMPGKLQNGVKRRGTIARKNKNDFLDEVTLDY